MNRISWILAILLFLFVVAISGIHGHLGIAFLSLCLLILFLLTALPLSRFIFGKGPVSFILAFPIGFILHALLLAILSKLFGVNVTTWIVYTIVAAGIAILFRNAGKPSEESWENADTLWVLSWLIATTAVLSPAFFNVGRLVEQGFAYRAYFNADFFRNLAVTGSVSHNGIPPVNPYVSGYILHYYWFFHLLVAYWKTIFPSFRPDFLLVQFSVISVLMFVASLFVVVRRYVSSRKTFALLLPLLLVGGSYKGIYILFKLHELHLPWQAFAVWNVEGILRWHWHTPQVDMLYRAFLYAPQHLIALSVFFLLLTVWTTQSSRAGRIVVYVILFSSLGFSFFVSGILVVLTALLLVNQTLRHFRERWVELFLSGTIGLLFLFLYISFFQAVQIGDSLTEFKFGLDPAIQGHLFSYTILNWGAVLLIGLAGIFLHPSKMPFRILLLFLVSSFLLIYCVVLDVNASSDISLKTGYLSFVLLLLFGAGFIDWIFVRHPGQQKWMVLGVVVLLIPASITWLMEAFNSQDIRNRKFTTYINREDAIAMQWMRNNLPEKAVIQNYSLGRGSAREFATEVPSFAERSVFVGDKILSRIFQIPKTVVNRRTDIVWSLFNEEAPARVYEDCRLIGIDYVFLSTKVKETAQEIREQLVEPYFTVVKQEGEALVFRRNEAVELRPEDLVEKVLREEKDRPVLRASFNGKFSPPEIHNASDTARWMSNDGEILLNATKRLEGTLQFSVAALGHDRQVEVYFNDELVRGLIASPNATKVIIPAVMKEGENRLRIHCPDGPESADTYMKNGDHRMLTVKIIRLRFTK